MNILHRNSELLATAATSALSQGYPLLSVGLDQMSLAILREADDAQEQIDEGLDADHALATGLSAALWRMLQHPSPALRSPHSTLLPMSIGALAGYVAALIILS